MRGVEGETVQVHGGFIVRSTGRKDRHSKVYTAKGPRDRRVRLSANTAIQFYDVQDRLGFDRPSKAVDWLIMNAKPAIEKLAGVPPWQPHITVAAVGDDNNNNNNTNGTSYMMEIVGTSADSKELKHLAAPGIVPEQQLGSGSNSVMGMISMKDLGLSLQSFQVQKQREQTVLPASSADLLGFGFAAGDACSVDRRNEFSFNQQPPVGLNGCSLTQRETIQFSFSTSLQQPFSFAGHFGSEGFPGTCIPPGQVHDDEDSSDVGLQEPPSSYIS